MPRFSHHPDYTVYVRLYFRIRNGKVELVRQHYRRPWGSACTRTRVAWRRRHHPRRW